MKKRIAVIFGGHSTEYDVSLQSSFSVLQNINKSHFEIVPVGITRDGEWYHYTGKIENISNNSWIDDEENLYPIMVSQSRLAQGFREFYGNKCREIPIDLVFPILHGKNGEDGTLQGLFELAGIPVVGCNTLSSAICMDKDRAHKLVSLAGIAVPKSVSFRRDVYKRQLQIFYQTIKIVNLFSSKCNIIWHQTICTAQMRIYTAYV